MRRRLVVALTAAALTFGAAVPSGAWTDYTQGSWQEGPRGGDAFNAVVVRKETGTVTVLGAYPLPGPLGCGARGGFGGFRVRHPADAPVHSVYVEFTGQVTTPFAYIFLTVRDARDPEEENWAYVGRDEIPGPVESDGTLRAVLDGDLAMRRDLVIDFGVRLDMSCPGLEQGTVKFTRVHVNDVVDAEE